MSYYRWREGHLQAKDTMNEHINAALESGVTPDQFRAEYEKRQSTAVNPSDFDNTITHEQTTCCGVLIRIGGRLNTKCINLSAAEAIRWGLTLVARGRDCK